MCRFNSRGSVQLARAYSQSNVPIALTNVGVVIHNSRMEVVVGLGVAEASKHFSHIFFALP